MKTGTIYKITHIDSGKSYIGQTINKPEQRWAQHWNYSKRAQATGKRLYNLNKALLKYGKAAFTFKVIESNIKKDLLDAAEISAIAKYDTFNNGYNLNTGGTPYKEQGFKATKYRQTAKHKLAISNAKKGITPEWTTESKNTLVVTKLGTKNPNYGKKAMRTVCEHCNKDVAKNIYIQYHGEKCKALMSTV